MTDAPHRTGQPPGGPPGAGGAGADEPRAAPGAEPGAQPSVEQAYAGMATCSAEPARLAALASLVLAIFDAFYQRLCQYPHEAQCAFETLDTHAAVRISKERLDLYSAFISAHGPRIRAAFPDLSHSTRLWDAFDERFLAMIADRYEADIAFSFAHSLRRNIAHELWRPVAYSFPPPSKRRAQSMAAVHQRLPVAGGIDPALLRAALQIPGLRVPFRDIDGDARRIVARMHALFRSPYASPDTPQPVALDVVKAGFFRDRTAFLVARWLLDDGSLVPLVVALHNSPEGIFVDAVLHRTSDIHNLFSSALANFHVTTRLYYQTCVFLYSIMPLRPLGHQYSTIGYNHVGKVAILNEIAEQMRASGQRFRRSPGAPGTVALGFTFEACSYHLKVIRDRPTASYKWGAFPGVPAVLEKYRVVHEINRAGSMLDNVIYFNLRLDRDMFDPELLDEILEQAAGSVQVDAEGVLMRSLIVQLKIVPLPVYLDSADDEETRLVMASLGHCIRNNAATNIFNKDLDSRNYGVGRYGRVLLFDYDAVERLTDVKIRTNLDREAGEEAPPDWFFESGTVFLPEELESGMQFRRRYARKCFCEINDELLTMDYWRQIQERLERGEIPELSMYPDSARVASDTRARPGSTAASSG
jgi:isocitrate dehydrogenase kinase/phosphatase